MSRRRSKTKKRGRRDEPEGGVLFDDPEDDPEAEEAAFAADADDDESLDDYDALDEIDELDDEDLPFGPSSRRRFGYRDMDDWN